MPRPYKKHSGVCADDDDWDFSTPAPPPLRRPFEDAMDDDDTRGRNSALVEEGDVERKEMGAVREEQVQPRTLSRFLRPSHSRASLLRRQWTTQEHLTCC